MREPSRIYIVTAGRRSAYGPQCIRTTTELGGDVYHTLPASKICTTEYKVRQKLDSKVALTWLIGRPCGQKARSRNLRMELLSNRGHLVQQIYMQIMRKREKRRPLARTAACQGRRAVHTRRKERKTFFGSMPTHRFSLD